MTNPIKYCTTCERVRDCMLHLRADFPPEAAERWLRRSCPRKGVRPRPCDIRYQAGIMPASKARGQG